MRILIDELMIWRDEWQRAAGHKMHGAMLVS